MTLLIQAPSRLIYAAIFVLALPFGGTHETFTSAAQEPKTIGEIIRIDPKLDELIAPNQSIEVLASGFEWAEGPVWVPADQQRDAGGYLLFSDIPNNRIVKYQPAGSVTTFLEPSGYTGDDKFTGAEPGTNGLMLDAQGRLVMCAHGDRCIKRMDDEGNIEVLVDRYQGKRLNSPNDLVFHPSGALYFTDPPYGLPERENDPARELDFFGVYRWHNNQLTLLTREMTRPNGIAFSPDYRTLYVAQSDPQAAIWKSFPVKDDGTLGAGTLFYDATENVNKLPGLPDGMCVDESGNLWATGPGGVYIFTSQGNSG